MFGVELGRAKHKQAKPEIFTHFWLRMTQINFFGLAFACGPLELPLAFAFAMVMMTENDTAMQGGMCGDGLIHPKS